MHLPPISVRQTSALSESVTRPIPGSRKIHVDGSRADLRVPMREVALTDTPLVFGAEKNAPIALVRHLRAVHRSASAYRSRRRSGAAACALDRRARRQRNAVAAEFGIRAQARRRSEARRGAFSARAQSRRAQSPARMCRRCTTRAAASSRRRWNSSRSARISDRDALHDAGLLRAASRRKFRRGDSEDHHAGIRAQRSRARPRDHSVQHQPSGNRADDHRPQLPDQDQREYRQLGRVQFDRRGSREDGLGDPLGRRHGHGSVDRQEHPRDARMDHPQLAGADRHGADLPGAGKSRRQGRGTDLGNLPRHADRAGRAGRRLLHDPRRRAAALHPADRQARDRHRRRAAARSWRSGAWRITANVPVHALRGHLRDHEGVRRRRSRSATACVPARSPTPTTRRSSPNSTRSAS